MINFKIHALKHSMIGLCLSNPSLGVDLGLAQIWSQLAQCFMHQSGVDLGLTLLSTIPSRCANQLRSETKGGGRHSDDGMAGVCCTLGVKSCITKLQFHIIWPSIPIYPSNQVMPYAVMGLCQNWVSQSFVTWWYQGINRTKVQLPSIWR